MLAIKTSFGQGRYVAGEWDAVFSAISRPGKPPLLWCHANNGTATLDYTTQNPSLRLLAQHYTVCVADLGGNTWGNDTAITRVQQAASYFAGGKPLTLVAVSMGMSVALNYAREFPETVAAVAGIVPVLDLSADGPAEASLNAAYPPAYDDNNPTMSAHNPVRFAASLPETLPVGLWTSSNDTSAPPSTADEFVAERPTTERTVFGAYGHGGVAVAVPLVLDWLKGL